MGTSRTYLTDGTLDAAKESLNKMIAAIDDVKENNSLLIACKKNNIDYAAFRTVMYNALKKTNMEMEVGRPKFEMTPIEKMYSAILCIKDPEMLWPYMPKDAIDTLRHVLNSNLRQREIDILTERVAEGKTLEEVGNEFGITRERVRQIEAHCLRKLRAPYLVKLLTYGLAEMKATDELIAKERAEIVNQRKEELLDKAREKVDIDCQKLLVKSIDELDLSVRPWHCLHRAGVETLEQLSQMTEADLMKIRNMGIRSVDEIISKCSAVGIHIERNCL